MDDIAAVDAGARPDASGVRLYDYFRSSAAYRIRIALNLKRIAHETVAVDLRADDQRDPGYRALNPQGLVPMLEIDGLRLTQSLAIIDYLDTAVPAPQLIPAEPGPRARAMAMALTIACDIHPLNNLRVLRYLGRELGVEEPARDDWYRHWLAEGLGPLEAIAAEGAGPFLAGDAPGVADVLLVPQLYNARRFALPLARYPTLLAADAAMAALPEVAAAHPDRVGG